jgi:hypothetical protein
MPHGQWVAFEGDKKHDCNEPRQSRRAKSVAGGPPRTTSDIDQGFDEFNLPVEVKLEEANLVRRGSHGPEVQSPKPDQGAVP